MPRKDITPYWSDLINDFVFIRRISENLFIYHGMFKQFLIERLYRTYSSTELERLHEKACSQLLSKNIATGGIYHAKKSNNSEKILEASQAMVEFAFNMSDYFLLERSLGEVSIDIRWSDAILAVYQGRLYQYRREYGNALKWYGRARDLFEESDDEVWKIGIVNDIGSILRITGKVDDAIEAYSNVLSKNKMDLPSVNIGEIISNRANCYMVKEMFDNADKDYEEAEEIFNLHGYWPGIPLLYCNKALLFKKRGQSEEVKELYKKALLLAVKYNKYEVMYRAGSMLSQIYIEEEKNLSLALDPLKYAVEAFLQTGYMDENIPFILNNYGLSLSLAEEPKTKGIEPLVISLKMKETKGLKISGNLQNLTTLLIRLGRIDILEPYVRKMIVSAEKERDDYLKLEGLAKLEFLYELNNKSNDEFLLSKLPTLEKSSDKDKFRIVIRKMYLEGSIRIRLNNAVPLFSQISSNDNSTNGNAIFIEIKEQQYSIKKSSSILVTTEKDWPLKEYLNVVDDNLENYLIEFLTNPADIRERASHTIAIWWLRKSNLCWVQGILSTREDNDSHKYEVLKGQLFRVDGESNGLFEEHHEENCPCGNFKTHEELFYIAANVINRYHENKINILPLTYNEIDYQVIIK